MPYGIQNILNFLLVYIPKNLFLESILGCVETNIINIFYWGHTNFVRASISCGGKIGEMYLLYLLSFLFLFIYYQHIIVVMDLLRVICDNSL